MIEVARRVREKISGEIDVIKIKSGDMKITRFDKTSIMPDTWLGGKMSIEEFPVTPMWVNELSDVIQVVRKNEIIELFEKSISKDLGSKEQEKKKKLKLEDQGVEFG